MRALNSSNDESYYSSDSYSELPAVVSEEGDSPSRNKSIWVSPYNGPVVLEAGNSPRGESTSRTSVSSEDVSFRDLIFTYGPKIIPGLVVMAAANVPRFFSAEKAARDMTKTENKSLSYSVGAAAVVANTTLGVFGSYKAVNLYREGKLKVDPIFLLLAAGTAASDVFNGVLLACNPITTSDALWSRPYIYTAAGIVFLSSFGLNLFSALNADALWCRDKEDIIAAEELKSLSYHLIGRSEEDLEILIGKIAVMLMSQDEMENRSTEELIGIIKGKFRGLSKAQRLKFMNDLRLEGFPIRSTRNFEFLWFTKGFSIASAVLSAMVLFYGPYALLGIILEHFGINNAFPVAQSLFGSFPLPIKTAVYYNLDQGFFFKLCHGMDTLRNFNFIEKNASMWKRILLPIGFVGISSWLFTSGAGFYYSVEDFWKFIYSFWLPDTQGEAVSGCFSDSFSDGASAGLSPPPFPFGLLELIDYLIGVLTACRINEACIWVMTEVLFQSYLSQGHNRLSKFFDKEGIKLSTTMPHKTWTWRIWDGMKDIVSAGGARMYACVSSGSTFGDEEEGFSLQHVADESTPLRDATSPNASRYSFFSAVSNCVSTITPRPVREPLNRMFGCC